MWLWLSFAPQATTGDTMVATFGRRCVLGGLLAAPLMLSAGAPAVRAQDGLRVVSTTGMVGDLAAGVLGGAGTAETLMGEGVDPPLYKMTRAALSRPVAELGRASCRARVCQDVSISVVAVALQKTNPKNHKQ